MLVPAGTRLVAPDGTSRTLTAPAVLVTQAVCELCGPSWVSVTDRLAQRARIDGWELPASVGVVTEALSTVAADGGRKVQTPLPSEVQTVDDADVTTMDLRTYADLRGVSVSYAARLCRAGAVPGAVLKTHAAGRGWVIPVMEAS